MSADPIKVVPISHNRGRQSTYDDTTADVICERLAEGMSLLAICQDPTLPPESTVRLWVKDDVRGFAARYARARDMGLDHVNDEILAIVDTEPDPVKARVRMDARRWYLSKLAPKRYGEKLAVEHTGVVEVLVDKPPAETREQWLERKKLELEG